LKALFWRSRATLGLGDVVVSSFDDCLYGVVAIRLDSAVEPYCIG
jgi:hypothetical protein